jgi:hypothetical protein
VIIILNVDGREPYHGGGRRNMLAVMLARCRLQVARFWHNNLLRRVWDWRTDFLILRGVCNYAKTVRSIHAISDKKCESKEPLILGVIGGYPIQGYLRLGYDWVGVYYNPLLFFKEVHYFQVGPPSKKRLDFGYPFYVHEFCSVDDVVRICHSNNVSVLRGYDPVNGRVAIDAARSLSVPVVVSIH